MNMVAPVRIWPSPVTTPEAMDVSRSNELLKSGAQERTRKPVKSRHRPSVQHAPAGPQYRFCTVDHPDQFRNPQHLRANRRHVMQDYLDKERMNPSTTDQRVQGHGPQRKRKRSSPSTSDASQRRRKSISSALTPQSKQSPRRPTTPSRASSVVSDTTWNSATGPSLTKRGPPSPAQSVVDDDRQLIPGIAGRHKDHTFHSTPLHEIEFISDRLGSPLNPFEVWPGFDNPRLDIARLKLSCNRLLGSRKLGEQWVPLIVKKRHAFVSTCCISTAHDDIMTRANRDTFTIESPEWYERMCVRHEVINMINDSLADPKECTTDATIIAVLQLLTAEAMGCDDRVTRVHIDGLHSMIAARGGLYAFDEKTPMALALTTTMYMIANLRETLPHEGFVTWARRQNKRSEDNGRAIPESPIHYRKPGFVTVRDALPPGSPTLALLNDLRELTDAFMNHHNITQSHSTDSSAPSPGSQRTVATLSVRIAGYKHHQHYTFKRTTDRYRYEAIRLTAQIYAFALSNRVPFSRAAQLIGSKVPGDDNSTPIPLPIRIKFALKDSDMGTAWDALSGVLLWISLVVGAAANPDMDEFYFDMRESADEDARKFISAIAMRVSILHTFEHSASLLASVTCISEIQQALKGVEDLSIASKPIPAALSGTRAAATFANYANEFRTL